LKDVEEREKCDVVESNHKKGTRERAVRTIKHPEKNEQKHKPVGGVTERTEGKRRIELLAGSSRNRKKKRSVVREREVFNTKRGGKG